MILVAVDDLMFSSKLRATAARLGVELEFARTPDDILRCARRGPSLAIFDLNSARCQPVQTIASMKSDPQLAAIPTIGFVSHVDTAVIDAARDAGTDEVLPRSAFTARLAEILERGR